MILSQTPAVISEPLATRTAFGRFTTRGLAWRLFFTCWMLYSLHLATNTVREIYLALAIGDHFSFRVDEYANLHPDLFEKQGYGWHIGANPGASMIAAIPYALSRPVVDRIVERVNQRRAATPGAHPPKYNSPWPMSREFYERSWRLGFDIKFGLAAVIMQTLCMAPFSALGVVAMFYLLRKLLGSDETALWMALLYAFGTPVFLRTGYLNHNMMIGHVAFLGLLALWNPGASNRWPDGARWFAAGIAGGASLLLDYSGVVFLLGLLVYGLAKNWTRNSLRDSFLYTIWYGLGSLGPIGLLWLYQWRSFGNPFLPGQHWMPPVEWIGVGYQGFSLPQPDLLASLLFDYRYGLFVACPLFLLALLAPFFNRGERRLPASELGAILGMPASLWLFCAGISYTRLQFNTGIRYLAPLFPFLFVAVALVLVRLPRRVTYFAGVAAIAQAWCMAMYRDVERGFGVLDPILQVFLSGFKLPVLTVLARLGDQFGEYLSAGVSPLPWFVLAGAILYGVWGFTPRRTG